MRRVFLLVLLLVVFGLVGTLGVAFGANVYFETSGLIAPGVTLEGVPLEGLPGPEAALLLERAWNQETVLPVVDSSDPLRSWPAHPAEFGIRVDAVATAQRAVEVGRGQGLVENLLSLAQSARMGSPLRPVVIFDAEAARRGLEAWALRVYVPPTEGVLAILEDGSILATPGLAGKALDVEPTLAIVASNPASLLLTHRFIPLVMRPVEPTIGDVTAAAADAERLLSTQVVLSAYDPVTGEAFTWSPTRSQIAAWLRIEQAGETLRVAVVPDALAAYVEQVGASLGEERTIKGEAAQAALLDSLLGQTPSPVRIRYQPRSYVVGGADTLVSIGVRFGMPYWRISEANPQVAARGLVPGETITIPPRDINLPLPVVPNKRIVISLGDQHMWLYQDGGLVAEYIVSTGIARSPTLPGIFQVQTHVLNAYASIWDLWMPHFLGIYEAVPGFWNGIHGLPLLSNGVRLWGSVLGRPASYGCIILDLEAGEWVYDWAEEGVVVEIRR